MTMISSENTLTTICITINHLYPGQVFLSFDPRTRSQSLACIEHYNAFGMALAESVPALGILNIVQYLHSSHVCFC
jgi:hypothetical protein